MRLRTAMTCTAFLVLLFTIAVWSIPIVEEESSRTSLHPSNNETSPRSFT